MTVKQMTREEQIAQYANVLLIMTNEELLAQFASMNSQKTTWAVGSEAWEAAIIAIPMLRTELLSRLDHYSERLR